MIDIQHKVKTAQDFLVYKLTAKSSEGHGIHSPFVYSFVRNVIRDDGMNEDLEKIEHYRNKQENSKIDLSGNTYGAGSSNGKEAITLGKLVRSSSVNAKLGCFLYRLSKWLNAKTILELGTSVGISTLYFAKACPQAKIITLEGNIERAALARHTFKALGCGNVDLYLGEFDDSLAKVKKSFPLFDIVLFDGNHSPEPTLRYFTNCCENKHEFSIFVFDDIRWSEGMYKTWQVIANHKSVTVSFDLFTFGVVLFRKGIPKQHFAINL